MTVRFEGNDVRFLRVTQLEKKNNPWTLIQQKHIRTGEGRNTVWERLIPEKKHAKA